MAINNKPTVPAPAIFTSDPLEQIAMRGIGDDPKKSGLMYMFLNAFDTKRQLDQQAYLQGVDKANQQSVALGQKELEAAKWEQTLKSAVDLAKVGADVNAMPATAELFKPGSASTLQPELMRSQIYKNMHAGDGKGGGEPGSKDQVKVIQMPGGSAGYEITTKGPGGLTRAEQQRAIAVELLKGQKAAGNTANEKFIVDQFNKYNIPGGQ